MSDTQAQPLPSMTRRESELLTRLYRDIGISAVAAVLAVRASSERVVVATDKQARAALPRAA